MPASVRAHVSRTTPSRPYSRRSTSASPSQPETSHLSRSLPPPSPIQVVGAVPDTAGTDVPPNHPGLPTYVEYKRIEAGYLHSLSPRKRDKALITQAMFDKIWDVLHQPEACTVDTPQFRFWVRKMFTLSRPVRAGGDDWGEAPASGTDADADAQVAARELERSMMRHTDAAMEDDASYAAVVLHEHRPVAIMEQLYELFCYCHVRAGHGGRDKTCAVIREHYSWVPKELTAQFVKACPTCVVKRSGQVPVTVDTVGQRRAGRKGRMVPLEAEVGEVPAKAESVGLGWPTTEGPLDPANPKPCGVRERERKREWLRAQGDTRGIGSPNPVSPNRPTPAGVLLGDYSPGGWITDARPVMSPDLGCNVTRSPGHPLVTNNGILNARRNDREKGTRSATKTGLPSLASALSDESLDENVNLTSPGPVATAEGLLPPVLRPLRLRGPIASDTTSDLQASYPLQIDPVLLSFGYPGLGMSAETVGFASECQGAGDAMMSSTASTDRGSSRLPAGAQSSLCVDIPLLDPEASFEHDALAAYTSDAVCVDTLPLPFSTELAASRRCHRGSFDAFYHPADKVGQHLDASGPISFSIMADA